MTMLKPQAPSRPLEVPLVGGGHWPLPGQRPDRFTLVVFYRGCHCPLCRGYLRQLESLSAREWSLTRLPVGHGQGVDSMREWGLPVSKGTTEGEPDQFGEPGLFLVRSDGTLHAAVLNTVPSGRPHLDELVGTIRWANDHDYPARGGPMARGSDAATRPGTPLDALVRRAARPGRPRSIAPRPQLQRGMLVPSRA